MVDRWATFDCYGTLVDWNAGIAGQLERLFGPDRAPALLTRYHELEPEIEESYRSYRDVMAQVLVRLADEAGAPLAETDRDALAVSLPGWPMFPEVPSALAAARRRGWKLAVLSNSDRDLIRASQARIGVPFDHTVVAEDTGSYKPAYGHWERFFADTGAARDRHVHVGASLFHDIAPAHELGLQNVWVNRLGETPGPEPTREVADLGDLPDVLDELVPS